MAAGKEEDPGAIPGWKNMWCGGWPGGETAAGGRRRAQRAQYRQQRELVPDGEFGAWQGSCRAQTGDQPGHREHDARVRAGGRGELIDAGPRHKRRFTSSWSGCAAAWARIACRRHRARGRYPKPAAPTGRTTHSTTAPDPVSPVAARNARTGRTARPGTACPAPLAATVAPRWPHWPPVAAWRCAAASPRRPAPRRAGWVHRWMGRRGPCPACRVHAPRRFSELARRTAVPATVRKAPAMKKR
eukprot:ctg_616.g270